MEIALGVHCVYCHDADNQKRDLDVKPTKAIARKMIQMVNDINRTTFDGRNVVTCFTCHRGSTAPVTVLPYNGEAKRSVSFTPVAEGSRVPTVDQIIDKSVTALGGAEALAKIVSVTAKGVLRNLNHIDQVHTSRALETLTPVEYIAKGADKRMFIRHDQDGDFVTTYNSSGSWIRDGDGAPRDPRSDALDIAKLENAVADPARFRQVVSEMKVLGSEKVGALDAWVVSGRMESLPLVNLYFAKDSGILLSMLYHVQSGYCCHAFRVDYEDFYFVDGIRVPLRWTVNGPRESIMEYQISEVETNTQVNDRMFTKPNVPARR